MSPDQLRQCFQVLCEDPGVKTWGLAPVQTAGFEATHEDFDNAEAAWQALDQAAPTAGWIQWQSHQTHFTDGLPQPESDWGALLAAEAAISETESLRLDFLDGQWRIIRYRHIEEGGDYLCDLTYHLLHGTHDRYLRYRRYWTIDSDQGAVQVRAVFVSISGKRED